MLPCAFYDWDEAAARDRLTHPVDNCQMECDRCGFNPAAAKARIERMRQIWQSQTLCLSERSL